MPKPSSDFAKSQDSEAAARRREQDERIRRFSEENKIAIDSYNKFIRENGIWSEEYREL